MKKSYVFMAATLLSMMFLAGCSNPLLNQEVDASPEIGQRASSFSTVSSALSISDLYLDEYMFPGTHNAYNFKKNKNQNLNISDQLAMGIRTMELDFHKVLVYKFPTFRREIRTAHGLHNTGGVNLLGGTTPAQEILLPIRNFLDANPDEIITLKLEYYDRGEDWSVSSAEVAAELATADLDAYIYVHDGGSMPTIGELVAANKRLIITGFNDLRSFSEYAENAGQPNTWDLEFQDSPFIERKLTNILMAFTLDDTIGIGAYDESVNNNKYDFLLRFTQRNWLRTGRKPMHITIDFCETGDLMAVTERINSYPIYKGVVNGLPQGKELQWELVYEKNGTQISQTGYSDNQFSFPGSIWFGGEYYNLLSLTPLEGGTGISLVSDSMASRGGITVSEREYSYGSGNTPFPLLPDLNGNVIALKNSDCDLYLTIAQGSGDNGADAVGEVLTGGGEQEFLIEESGDFYRFQAVHSGKRLDVDNPDSPFNGYDAYLEREQYNRKGHFENARVHQYSANDKYNQMWIFSRKEDGTFVIISRENGKALSLAGFTEGSAVVMKEYGGLPGQSWELIMK